MWEFATERNERSRGMARASGNGLQGHQGTGALWLAHEMLDAASPALAKKQSKQVDRYLQQIRFAGSLWLGFMWVAQLLENSHILLTYALISRTRHLDN